MNISFDWPTITADDLEKKATAFADELVARLEKFNSANPAPDMDERFDKAVPGPNPGEFIDTFKIEFCRYMAARQIIVRVPT